MNKIVKDDLLKEIAGGFEMEQLTPDERGKFEKWSEIYREETMRNLEEDPAFNRTRLEESKRKLIELSEEMNAKYGE